MPVKQNIPWLRIGAESIAIVASILLAFGIDAWWDARSSLSRTEQLLQALEAEWSSELGTIDQILDQIAVSAGAMNELIEIGRRGATAVNEDAALNAFSNSYLSTYKPTVGALNSLLLSNLENISNADLRSAIASWPGVLDEIKPEQDALHELALFGFRRVTSRVAQRVQRASSQPADYEMFYGVQRKNLAVAIVHDEEWQIVVTQFLSVLDSYNKQLIAVRSRLDDNLLLLRNR